MRNPCKDCIRRDIGCHAHCKEYLAWKKEIVRRHNMEKRERYMRYLFVSHIMKNRRKK